MTAYSPKPRSDQLLQLSDEVNRIAGVLAQLSAFQEPAQNGNCSAETNEISPETVRWFINARRARSRFFEDDLFADPAWDILLDLFAAELTQRRVSVSSACIAAAVPATTAIRWISRLVREGLLVRQNDPFDGRRVFVELAPNTSAALRQYFAQLGSPPTA